MSNNNNHSDDTFSIQNPPASASSDAPLDQTMFNHGLGIKSEASSMTTNLDEPNTTPPVDTGDDNVQAIMKGDHEQKNEVLKVLQRKDEDDVSVSSGDFKVIKEKRAFHRGKRRKISKGNYHFCKGNPIRTCHKNELMGGNGDRRCRCAVCSKKTNFFCLDCQRWLCLSTKTDVEGEHKFLRFSIKTSGRRRFRSSVRGKSQESSATSAAIDADDEEGIDEVVDEIDNSKTAVETLYAYRSCWNVYHSDVLKDYGCSVEGVDECIEEEKGNSSSEDHSKPSKPLTVAV